MSVCACFSRRLNVSQYTGTAWTWWTILSLFGNVTLNTKWSSKPDQGWDTTSALNFSWTSVELEEESTLQAPVNRSYHCADGVVFQYLGPNSSLTSYPWGTNNYAPPMLLNFSSLQVRRRRLASASAPACNSSPMRGAATISIYHSRVAHCYSF